MIRCGRCDAPILDAYRSTRRYCSGACRTAARRDRLGLGHGWGGPSDRKARQERAAAAGSVSGRS